MKWNLSSLKGISDKTLEMHFGLYEGYVKNTNLLNEQIAGKIESGHTTATDLEFSELNRRLAFEYNGMRLHELYFNNLTGTSREPGNELKTALAASYGDFETWKKDFAAIGSMRGVGWAIAFQDPANGRITNHWVELHQDGNLATFSPIVVMDVWEHAFMLDYKPADRSKYIEAFFTNVDWETIAGRLAQKSSSGTVPTIR
jgi:superoxide dismutase, Fe-Mn family